MSTTFAVNEEPKRCPTCHEPWKRKCDDIFHSMDPGCEGTTAVGDPCGLKFEHDGPCDTWMGAIQKFRESLPPDAFADAFCERCGRLETRCGGHEAEDLRAAHEAMRRALFDWKFFQDNGDGTASLKIDAGAYQKALALVYPSGIPGEELKR
jgi:hypothetical protein